MSWSCEHKWELVTETFDKSPIERLIEMNSRFMPTTVMPCQLEGTRIIILKCTECGKLDKTIKKV